jgi:hypothetical protein
MIIYGTGLLILISLVRLAEHLLLNLHEAFQSVLAWLVGALFLNVE